MDVTRRRLLGLAGVAVGGLLVPTSNGQVTTRDIRRDSIVTTLLHDDAVATDKLADLAVTVGKVDDPIWTTAPTQDAVGGTDLGALIPFGTPINTVTFDVPTWVAQLSVFAVGRLQLANTSGGDAEATVAIAVNGDIFEGGSLATVPDNDTGLSVLAQSVDLLSPGATLTVEMYAGSGVGSGNTPNTYFGRLNLIVVGTR